MFLDRFIQFLRYEKNYSNHTLVSYHKDIKNYVFFLESEGFTVQTATLHQVRSYLSSLMAAHIQARSVNQHISALRSFYKFLLRENLVTQNPMLLVKALKTPTKLPEIIAEDKLLNLLDAKDTFSDDFYGQRDRLVMELFFGTGIRREELMTISEHDIDFYHQTIRIFGKGRKERIIPLTQSLISLLEEYIKLKKDRFHNNKSIRLIVTNKGGDAYAKLIYRIVNHYLTIISSQQKKSPHVLRHSFATALLNRGAKINDIKELLGHAGLAATQVYTHNSVERLKSIYKQAHPKA